MVAISGSGGERLVAIGQIDASGGDGENDESKAQRKKAQIDASGGDGENDGSKAQRKKAQIDASSGDGDERKKD